MAPCRPLHNPLPTCRHLLAVPAMLPCLAGWDTWFNMHCQAARIAPSGSRTGLESAEQRLAREVDAAFAEALLSA